MRMKSLAKIFALFIIFAGSSGMISGCATVQHPGSISSSEYEAILEPNTKHVVKYSGLYNDYDVSAVLLTPEVARSQVDYNHGLYLWTEEKHKEEAQKVEEKLAKETDVFVSFFAPEKKHNDLSRSKTLWKIFLEVDGQRYDGVASRFKSISLTEIQSLYPFHTRFGTPYIVTFPVSALQLTNKNPKVTITGPVGTMDFTF